MDHRFKRLVTLAVLGCAVTGAFAQNAIAKPPAVSCNEPVIPPIRKAYFAKLGIGVNYGPHYPCYVISSGAAAQCLNPDGSAVAGVQADAKNNEMESSVPLDLQQLQSGGFTTVRAYGDPSKVWIAMINRATDLGLKIVYQVDGCQSDDAPGQNGRCINVPGSTFESILQFSLAQLHEVIQQVGSA